MGRLAERAGWVQLAWMANCRTGSLRFGPETDIIAAMRVLLVYSNQSHELVPAPPVGLSYVATATRAAGHDVHLLDLVFSAHLERDLAAAIAAYAPDVVGLSIRNIDNVVLQRFESPRAALLSFPPLHYLRQRKPRVRAGRP